MSTEASDPPRGYRDPTTRRWAMRESVVAVGVAAVIAGLGGAAIYAATDTSHQSFGPRSAGGPPPSLDGPLHAAGQPTLHGEFVTSDGAGGFTTMLMQAGTITAVSPTSFTVRSADAFTQTYQLAGGAATSVVPNDEVVLRATRTGATLTVTDLQTQTRLSPGGPDGPPRPGTQN